MGSVQRKSRRRRAPGEVAVWVGLVSVLVAVIATILLFVLARR
jgi:hypothetical protein